MEVESHQQVRKGGTPMNRKYDIFEKFSDGSSLWRGCVLGLKSTRSHLQELSGESENQFYAIDISSGKTIRPEKEMDLNVPRKFERQRKSAVA